MPLAHIGGRLTVLIMALGAVDIINSIGLSVAQVSILILVSSLTALTAPWLGIIIDRWEPRKFYIISIVISLLSLIGLALSSSFIHFLLVAVMAGPIFEGLSASATKLIARHVFPGKKGMLLGSNLASGGIAFAIVGLGLPVGINLIGWRMTILCYALIPLAVLIVALLTSPTNDSLDYNNLYKSKLKVEYKLVFNPVIIRLALHAFCMGAIAIAGTTFIPIYAREVLNISPVTVGFAFLILGIIGSIGQIIWGYISDVYVRPTRVLFWVAIISSISATFLLLGPVLGVFAIWIAAISKGAGVESWHSTKTVAVVKAMDEYIVGRSITVVDTAFRCGVAVWAPLMGWIIDRSGSYTMPWIIVSILGVIAALLVLSRKSLTVFRQSELVMSAE